MPTENISIKVLPSARHWLIFPDICTGLFSILLSNSSFRLSQYPGRKYSRTFSLLLQIGKFHVDYSEISIWMSLLMITDGSIILEFYSILQRAVQIIVMRDEWANLIVCRIWISDYVCVSYLNMKWLLIIVLKWYSSLKLPEW
jgi:hypothetical protein